jgi:mono/diheme cytochrome c family protein
MPAYGYQLKTEDVWAVVHYVRALQRSQNASFDDLPNIEKEKMKKE